MSVYNILDYGAVPGYAVNSAQAIQQAIDAASAAGGGTVWIPAEPKGFMSGSLVLKSYVRLYLESGAVLKASPDINAYVSYAHLDLFATSDFCRFWIFACEAEQIAIEGNGTLDGNSPAFVTKREQTHTIARNPRAQSIVFLGCRDVVMRNVRVIQTPSWAIRPAGCERVLLEGLTILNDLGLVNSDGIDIDCCRSVRIANCHIEAGDDAISIKGRREIAVRYGACEDIVVTGCVLESHCCAFRLGCESHVDFRRIVFGQSTIRRSHRGIAIDCRDPSVVEDILIVDLAVETIHSPRIWWHEGEAIWISQVPDVAGHYSQGGAVARLRNVVFRNIHITSEQGVYVQGADAEPRPQELVFESVHVHLRKRTTHPAGFFDPRPNPPGFLPAGSTGIEEETRWGSLYRHGLPGFFFDRARDITLRNCRVTWEKPLPDVYTHALEAWDAPGLQVENFRGTAASAGVPTMLIDGLPEEPEALRRRPANFEKKSNNP